MAVSSAYSARDVFGGWGMSDRNNVKISVDKTAPWGSLAGGNLDVDDVSLRWTVKVRFTRNALRMYSRYVGKLKVMGLYRSPCIHTVS
jgi:hypothetical protein